MWRIPVIAVLVSLVSLPASRADDDRTKDIDLQITVLKEKLRVLLEDHGDTHPSVVAVKKQVATLVEASKQAALDAANKGLQKILLQVDALLEKQGSANPSLLALRERIVQLNAAKGDE